MPEVHQRYRKFNTRDTYPNQKLDNDLCQVVKASGTLVFVRGQVGQDVDSFDSIASMSAYDQADRAMQNVKQLLEEAGSDLSHICRIQVYITDRAYRDDVYQAIGKWLKGVFPVFHGADRQRPGATGMGHGNRGHRRHPGRSGRVTFSIVGRCSRTARFGVAITTSSISVGARCPHARAGVGAVATQNVTDPNLGPVVLDALASGLSAAEALAKVTNGRENIAWRQLTVVDAEGRTAAFTGENILGTNAESGGVDCYAAGNLLSTTAVPGAMTGSFESNGDLHLAERLLRALEAGLAAGGEEGDVHSAALLVVDRQPFPLVDLRMDWAGP